MSADRILDRIHSASQSQPGGGAFAVFRSLDEIPAGFGPTVAAVGNFDGVHLGHREILAAVAAEARKHGRAGRRHHLRSAPGTVSAPGAGAAS